MGSVKPTIDQEVQTRYESSFESLANRCLGEPYNFHRVATMLLPGLLDSDLHSAKVVAACLRQFSKAGTYAPQTVAIECGMMPADAVTASMLDAEMDSPTAMDMFLQFHGQWAEMRISKFVDTWILKGLSSEEIQVEAARARKDFGLCSRLTSSDGKEDFEKRLLAAIDGKKFHFPVSPFLKSVREKVPYYEPGDYIVVAALTGNGKTYNALNQIHYLSVQGVPSCCINLENTPGNMQKRMWQIHSNTFFAPDLRGTDTEMQSYLTAWDEVKKMPFRSYNPGPSLPAIVSAIRQDWHERGIQFCVVDYAQLMNIPGYRGGRNYELGEISATFRALALELQIPIMVLAQMKQEVSKTGDKRGGLYDIKDCANFAQDATLVQCLYRPSVFNIKEDENGGEYAENYADIFIAKGRESGIALCEARFDHIKGFHDVEFDPSPFNHPPPLDYSIPDSARPDPKDFLPF